MNYVDILITAAIVAVVLYAAHRSGQVNPVGTGKLVRRMDALELKVAEQGARMDGIESAIITLTETSALTSKSVEAMRIELASDRGLTERTWAAVDRLQHFFIEDAFKARTGK